MSQPAKKKAEYHDLYDLPENMIGEIIDGELIATPRPSVRHTHAASVLGGEIVPPYQLGRGGGPGGWVILSETEMMLGEHLLVPDFAGWRKERFPGVPKENWISIAPDWICEILSPSTMRVDKVRKMPIYARHEIPYLWLIDPAAKTLDVFRLLSGQWVLAGTYVGNDKARAEPFLEIEIELGNFWAE
jgi:Uma2 family endonuclease